MYFCYWRNTRIMHNVRSRQQSKVIMAPAFRPVRQTEWHYYIQTEVKGDSHFLRNENADKNVKFWVISQYMGIFQGLYQINKDYWGSGKLIGPRQANLVLIVYASSEGSGEPAHPCSLARTFAARSYKQWIKRNLQTETQIPGPSEWLGMRSWICHDGMLEDTNSLDGAQLCSARVRIPCVLQLSDSIWKVCEGKLIHHVFFYSYSVWKRYFFLSQMAIIYWVPVVWQVFLWHGSYIWRLQFDDNFQMMRKRSSPRKHSWTNFCQAHRNRSPQSSPRNLSLWNRRRKRRRRRSVYQISLAVGQYTG